MTINISNLQLGNRQELDALSGLFRNTLNGQNPAYVQPQKNTISPKPTEAKTRCNALDKNEGKK